jgi:DNA invertase Pin-like site-specific DNA recombinase
MKYGYARVSTDDQNTALQRAALQRAGCTTIFTDEGLSGATVKRPALTRCLKALRPGDTLIVWKLNRLGRNLCDLITLLDALRTQGIHFQSLTEHIDTRAGRCWGLRINSGTMAWIMHLPLEPGEAPVCVSNFSSSCAAMRVRKRPSPR